MRDKLSTKRDSLKMTATTPDDARKFVRSHLEDIAQLRHPRETVKTMLVRVAIDVGMNFSKVRKYWYGEIDNIPWHEAETIRLRAQQIRDRWIDMQRRQDLAALSTDIQRTGHYGAEIARRREVGRRADLAGGSDGQTVQHHFWLGGDGADMDREE